MRALFHPNIEEISVEQILHAFADPVRVQIYADIAAADCAQTCSKFLSMLDRDIPKSTLSQHFRVLREAGLIRSERVGTEMRNVTRCDELRSKFGDLIMVILESYQKQLAGKRRLKKPKG